MAQFLQFDFTGPPGSAAPCRFIDPVEVVTAHRIDEALPALRRVQELVNGGRYAAGFVAYEAAPAFDPAMATPRQGDLPLVWFGLYEAPAPIDKKSGTICAAAVGEWTTSVSDARFRKEITAIRESTAAGDFYQVNHTQRMRASFEGDAFAWYVSLRAAQSAAYSAYLDLGRFQILSLSPELFFCVEPGLARPDARGTEVLGSERPHVHLRGRKCESAKADITLSLGEEFIPTPFCPRPPLPEFPRFAGYPRAGGERGVNPSCKSRSSCPNEPASGRTIVTRPMKGTHPRGRWPEEDLEFQECLRHSEKDRAENLMIVDLLRNDLGRIARTGSVAVDALFEVERYPTLLQMTSTISARLLDDVALPEIFSALFPCGSVTGAPKIAAMQRIAELEPDPRGAYCGAIGFLEPGGRAVFSVAIRTVVTDKETGVAEYGVGSGITWDSRAEAEAAENRLKAAVLSAPAARPDLFETLRLRDGVFARSERHLARLLASAVYFGIPADLEELRAALERQARERPAGLWRVRLRLSAAGQVSTECMPLEDPPDLPRTFALASQPVDRNDRRLFHKFADREIYASFKAERPDVYDVLLQNREGELTEFTTGCVVLEIGGERFTPPLDCGLLPGTLRAELLEAGELRERVLFPADLVQAERIWLINSLRGWAPMEYADRP